MIKAYLKIAFRNLLKSRAYSIINISGLAIGMAACFDKPGEEFESGVIGNRKSGL